MIVLRNLDTEGIALLYPLLGIFHIANQFGDFGFTTGFIKTGALHFQSKSEKLAHVFRAALELKIFSAFFVLAIGILFSTLISKLTFNSSQYTNYVIITFMASFFAIMGGYTNSLLQITERFKLLSFIKTAPVFIKFFLIVIFFYLFSFSFNQIFVAYFIVPILTFILGAFYIPYKDVLAPRGTKQERHEILSVSKWIYISTVAVAGIGQVDVLMVRSMLNSIDLANLVGAQKLSSLIPIITATLVTVLLPKISGQQDRQALNYFFRKTLLFIPIIVVVFIIGIFASDYIIPLLLGEKYIPSVPIFKYYLIGYATGLFITPISLILYSLNKEHLFILLNIMQFAINIVGNYFLIKIFNAEGAAITSSAIRVFGLLFVLVILWKEGIIFEKKSRS